tara:strand:- start:31565 stop:32722 length:1158 start_codon:yes stop_codon:yes gene_type:complete
MIAEYLLLFTGGIGLLTTYILIRNNHSNKMVNYYLIIICLYLSCFALLKSTYVLGIQGVFNQTSFGFKRLSLFLFPSLYLFFKHIIDESKKRKKTDLYHFIIPSLFYIVVQLLDFSGYLIYSIISFFYIFYFLFTSCYLLLSIRLFISSFEINSIKKIFINDGRPKKKWILFLLIIFSIISLRIFIIVCMDLYNGSHSGFEKGFWLWAILIIGIFIKLLISPEILFGSSTLKNMIEPTTIQQNESILVLNNWKFEKITAFNNKQDEFLAVKVNDGLMDKILAIEEAVLDKKIFRNSTFDIQSLALEINVPKSHLTYLFKYHSNLFFPDFKRMLQIKDAKNLIDNGFLSSNTLESLSVRVGFSSYNPFFKAFKKYTGFSPQNYINK